MPRKKGSKNAPKTVQKKTVAKETKHLLLLLKERFEKANK